MSPKGGFPSRSEYQLERNDADRVAISDVERALDEMLFAGGTLNLKLLGGEDVDAGDLA